MASTDATPQPIKAQALRITFPLWLTTGLVNSGASGLDSEVSLDAGTFADCTNEATEIASSSGTYYLDLTSGEMTADTVAIQVKSSTTNAITAKITIYPNSAGKTVANATMIGGQTASASGTITFPNATLASTTNITAGTITTVTTVTNQLTAAAIATGVWQDATGGDFTVSSSIGKSLYTSGVVPGGAGGHFISGSNAATTISGLTTGAIAATTITASGAVAFQSTFAVTTSTSLAALSATTVTFSGAVAFQSTVAVTGTTTLTGNVSLGGTLGVTGTTTLNALTVTNAFLVSGTTTFTLASATTAAIAVATRDVNNTSPAANSLGAAVNSAASAGDPWATTIPGAYGAGTAGFIVGTNLDAAVTTRMATYTQPTGFLAATFPTGTIANTTNITAGTITTVTNLTNAATSGDFTATMKASITTAVPTANVNADALLKRDWTVVTGEASRSVLNALRFLRNGFSIAGTTLSVLGEDDTTVVYTRDLAVDPAAVPIVGVS